MPKATVLTMQKREELYKALKEAMPFNYACDLCGIPRRTAYDYLKKDETFRTQVELSKAIAIRGLVALTSKQSGAWKLLKCLGKEEFKEVLEHEVTGSEGGPIQLIVRDYRDEGEKKDEH